MATKRKAYQGTAVSVEKSRSGIAKILGQWGATGVQWEDDLRGNGMSVLRFKWRHRRSGAESKTTDLVARIRLVPAIQSSTPKTLEAERRRLHRVAYYWLKSQHEAVEAGLFTAEEVILPWLEDASGNTLGESLRPYLHALETADFGKRLQLRGAR